MSAETTAGQEFGLIVQQQGKPQQVLARFLNLMLNYQYGLSVSVEQDPSKAAAQLLAGGVRCVFVVQNQEVKNQTTLTALSKRGELPLFLVVPEARLDPQRLICAGLDNVHFCTWQKAFSQSDDSLQHIANEGLDD